MPDHPVMKIFFGPPGTGKTYRAAREAVKIIDGSLGNDDADIMRRHHSYVAAGSIIWVTFHPSYSYEDFVEGFRPSEKEDSQIIYKVVDGPFKMACTACTDRTSGFKIGDQLGNYTVFDLDDGGVALKASVARADSVTGYSIFYADFWTLKYFHDHGILPDELSIPGKDYSRKRQVAIDRDVPTTQLTNSSNYRSVYEKLYFSGDIHKSHRVVLVIDEINRADLSRVFGELMTLLEADKRLGMPEERSIFLPYSKERFSVPQTLSVIGTMNTADRSLAVMDVALRRRFEFEEIEPDAALCPDNYGGIDLQQLLQCWNMRITALRSRDNRLGHSDLMKSKLEEVRTQNNWPYNEVGQRKALALTIREKILPLLLEYFYDDWRKAEVVLGNSKMLRRIDFADVASLAEDIVDLTEHSSFEIETWWDPLDSEWDPEKFAKELRRTYQSTV